MILSGMSGIETELEVVPPQPPSHDAEEDIRAVYSKLSAEEARLSVAVQQEAVVVGFERDAAGAMKSDV